MLNPRGSIQREDKLSDLLLSVLYVATISIRCIKKTYPIDPKMKGWQEMSLAVGRRPPAPGRAMRWAGEMREEAISITGIGLCSAAKAAAPSLVE